jgi:VWFA-related protein
MRRLAVRCVLISAVTLFAQEPPAIRVTTRLVQVNVIVHDKKGEPVSDLTKDDFVLFDHGKQQKISVFTMDSRKPLTKPVQPLPSNIFSNRLARKSETPTSVTAILIDGLNTRIQDQAHARAQLLKFLLQIQPQDRVALYFLSRDLRVVHDFTSDPERLIQALQKYKGRYSAVLEAAEPAPSDSGTDDLDQLLNDANAVASDYYNVQRAHMTLNALEAIANHLAGLPGRKNLIWLSGGFPFTIGYGADSLSLNGPVRDHRVFSEEADRVTRAMNNAGVAIYPVDARGLVGTAMFDAGRRSGPVTRNPANGRIQVPSSTPPNIDTMQILAENTGGRAFYNSNDLNGAIRKAIDDTQVTYTLGFYPASDDWDGKFHKLKVEVTRKGMDVRYRKGFMAFEEQTPTEKQRKAAISDAVTSPLEATGIGLNARVEPTDKPAPGSLTVVLQVNQEDITLDPKEQRWTGAIDLLYVQQGADGKILDTISQTVNINAVKSTYDAIVQGGLLLTKTMAPVKGAERMRVMVLDRPTGNIGSIFIPLKHP